MASEVSPTLPESLDQAFRLYPHAVYLLDRERRFIRVNDKAVEEFGLPRETLLGRASEQLLAPERRDAAAAHWQLALSGQPTHYETEALGPRGRFHVRLVLVPIRQGDAVVAVLGVAENITERRRHEAELAAARNMLQAVVDNLPAAVFWKDAEGRFQGCNRAFEERIGRRCADLLGRRDRELLSREEAAVYEEQDARVLAGEGDLHNHVVRVPQSEGHGWSRTSKVALRDASGLVTGLIGVTEDITERREMQLRLEHLALHDALTGLPNRARLEDHLAQAAARAERGQEAFAVLYFDIDRFKQVNDQWGHESGDAVIRAVAERATQAVRRTDLVARLGGDEFVVVLEGAHTAEAVRRVAESLREAVASPLALADGTQLAIGTSIGAAVYSPGMEVGDLLRVADAAMYAAKQSGRGRVVVAGVDAKVRHRPPTPPRSRRGMRQARPRRRG